MAGRGRPKGVLSKYTEEISNEIVERLSNGEPLRKICRDEHMPSWQTFYEWVSNREDFARRIAHARDLGYDAIAEECFDIADDTSRDIEVTENGIRPNTEFIQRSKLRIDTRLKLLAKWNPKKYGDKVDVTTKGEKIEQVMIIGGREIKFD